MYENLVEIVDIENDIKWEEAGECRRKIDIIDVHKR